MAEMYNWDKSHKEEKSRKNGQIPSFSSTLLDEIYRSIDGGDEKFGEFKVRKPKVAKKPSRGKSVEDEEIASFRRACLVEKWMEMKANEKEVVARSHGPPALPEFDRKGVLDNDPLFFSSGSSSSDSSFGWHSEAEVVKPKPSCFGPLKGPKHVKTSVSPRSAVKKQNEVQMFDDDQINSNDNSGLIRSKTRALKIYASLKKVKQPISPGGRLTTFLNTLFTNGHSKKPKDSGFEERTQTRMERKSKSTNVSTCSSATSYSRSCLNKNTPRSRDQLSNGFRRTVRFEDHQVSRPCGVKNIPPPTFSWARTEKPSSKELSTKYEDKKFDSDDEDDDDMGSDSSSDLFELDHLAILRDEKYCEELPVYETTHLGTNRAIASGLVC